MISIIQNLLGCVLGLTRLYVRRVCIDSIEWAMFHHLDPVDWWRCFVGVCPCWFSSGWICQLLKLDLGFSSDDTVFIYLAFNFFPSVSASHIYRLYIGKHMYINYWYIVVQPFFPYVMSLFVPKIFPCYDICLMAKFLFLAYISILVMYMYICGGVCAHESRCSPRSIERRHQSPWNRLWKYPEVGAGHWTWVLYKTSVCSSPLSQFSNPLMVNFLCHLNWATRDIWSSIIHVHFKIFKVYFLKTTCKSF